VVHAALARFVFYLIAHSRHFVGDRKNFGNFNVDGGGGGRRCVSRNTPERKLGV